MENKNFKKIKHIKFNPRKDFFQRTFDSSNVLSRETLYRDEPGSSIKNPSNDFLITLSKHCYQHNFKSILDEVKKQYKKYSKHPGFWNHLGTCFFLEKNYKQALLYYNKSIKINNNYAPAINNLGVLYSAIGLDQKAFLAYKKAMRINKFSHTPNYNTAMIYLKYGFIHKAQKILSSLYSLGKDDQLLLHGLGNIMLLRGKHKPSIHYFESMEDDYLEQTEVGLNYSLALFQNGQYDKAKNIFSSIKKNTKYSDHISQYIRAGD